ncbi:MAG: NifU family protein [Bacteroidia bacterium]|nr:NifU family protein [Bacteroidia bacterium]
MVNLIQRVEQALDTVRPHLQSDGGDVRLHQITSDLTVELELLGSCGSCSMSHMTMKAGVEEIIKKLVPEVKKVVTI